MPVKGLTQDEIDEATRAQVAAGGKSTDRNNRLPGETASEANARIAAAYKEMTAKPILSKEQKDAGMKVQFVRTGAGGVGEYVPIKPIGYTGPTEVKEFTPGVIPANSKYTTGTSVGFNPDDYKTPEDAQRIAAKVASGKVLTADEQVFLAKGVNAPTKSATPAAEPTADAATALRKLQSNQPLTDGEKKILGISVTNAAPGATPASTAKKFTPEELQSIIRRMTNGEKLTPEEAAAVGVSDPNSITPAGPSGPTGVGATGPSGPGATGATGPSGPGATGATGPTGPSGPGATGSTGPTGASPEGTTYTAPDGRIFTDLNAYNSYLAQIKNEEKRRAGQSAYDILYNEFDRYGLGSLVKEVQQYIVDGLSEAELTIKLRGSKPYQERFAANAKRIANGFKAIDEATYLGLEDRYQSIMQNYGLPTSYYEKGNLGVQKGFEELIGGNVDPVTLEERIIEGQKVTKGNKAIIDTAKQFFPTLTDGDFLGYVLNPKNGLEEIKRKVTAVEIGAGAKEADLNIGLERALEIGTAGINKAQAKQGFAAIGTGLQRGSQLAAIYGENPYTQTTAEEEVFGLAGKTKATREREKITGLEKATFGAKTGISSGALARDRAGAY